MQGKKGVWIKLPIHLVNLVEALVKVTNFIAYLNDDGCAWNVWLMKIGMLLMQLGINSIINLFPWHFYAGGFLVSSCRTKIFNACILDSRKSKYYSCKCHTQGGHWFICDEWKTRGFPPQSMII